MLKRNRLGRSAFTALSVVNYLAHTFFHSGQAVLLVTGAVVVPGCGLVEYEENSRDIQPPAWLSEDTEGEENIRDRVATETQRSVALRNGKKLYRDACAICHGLRGDGAGPSAQPLDPRPRDFTTGVFVMGDSNLDIFESIALGVPGSRMLAWEDLLSDEQMWSLVAHLRSFSNSRSRDES